MSRPLRLVVFGQLHCAGDRDPFRSHPTSGRWREASGMARSRPRAGAERRAAHRRGPRRPRRWPRPTRTTVPRGSHPGAVRAPGRAPRAGTAGRGGCARGGAVDVHVDAGAALRAGWASEQAGLLLRLAQRRVPRPLPRVDVASGLQPPVQALVHVEHVPRGPTTTADPVTCSGPACSSKGSARFSRSATIARLGSRLPLVAWARVPGGVATTPTARARGPAAASDRSPDVSRHGPSLPHLGPSRAAHRQRRPPATSRTRRLGTGK